MRHSPPQPLRGWGHSWPGHFLPTDPVHHYSRADGFTSADFEEVAPHLPGGWAWVEPEWRIDMRGRQDGTIDEEGWRYAFDFLAMKPTPAPGAGARTFGW